MGMLLFLKKITPLSISDLCLANISITDELKYFLIPRIDQKEKKERKLVSPPPPSPTVNGIFSLKLVSPMEKQNHEKKERRKTKK